MTYSVLSNRKQALLNSNLIKFWNLIWFDLIWIKLAPKNKNPVLHCIASLLREEKRKRNTKWMKEMNERKQKIRFINSTSHLLFLFRDVEMFGHLIHNFFSLHVFPSLFSSKSPSTTLQPQKKGGESRSLQRVDLDLAGERRRPELARVRVREGDWRVSGTRRAGWAGWVGWAGWAGWAGRQGERGDHAQINQAESVGASICYDRWLGLINKFFCKIVIKIIIMNNRVSIFIVICHVMIIWPAMMSRSRQMLKWLSLPIPS